MLPGGHPKKQSPNNKRADFYGTRVVKKILKRVDVFIG
jgi:hypothetical protein